jgi:hypothetical protein
MNSSLPSLLDQLGGLSLPFAFFVDWNLGKLLIPLAGIGLALATVILASLETMQKRRLRHELMRLALEKGQPLPPELIEPSPSKRNRDDRRSGLIWIAVGAAVFVFLGALVSESGVKWVALIPGFIGAALLLNWALERGDRNGQR